MKAVRARQAAAVAAQRDLELELAQVTAASEAAPVNAALIVDAGAAQRASHVDGALRHVVDARLSAPTAPASVSNAVSGARAVERIRHAPSSPIVAASVAPAHVPTGRVDSAAS